MNDIKEINCTADIPQRYIGTPVEKLLRYHNLNEPFAVHDSAEMLIGMCMDNRKTLRLPENFSYVIRTGGGNLRYSEFKVCYAIAIAGIKYIVLIAHNHCAMVNLASKKNQFIKGLIENAGWDEIKAEEIFNKYEPVFEITDEIDFVKSETERLRLKYPKVSFCPLFYNVEDNKLYVIDF